MRSGRSPHSPHSKFLDRSDPSCISKGTIKRQLQAASNFCCRCNLGLRLSDHSSNSPFGRLRCKNEDCGHVACKKCNLSSIAVFRDVGRVVKIPRDPTEQNSYGFFCCKDGCGWSQAVVVQKKKDQRKKAAIVTGLARLIRKLRRRTSPSRPHVADSEFIDLDFGERRCIANNQNGQVCGHAACETCIKFEYVDDKEGDPILIFKAEPDSLLMNVVLKSAADDGVEGDERQQVPFLETSGPIERKITDAFQIVAMSAAVETEPVEDIRHLRVVNQAEDSDPNNKHEWRNQEGSHVSSLSDNPDCRGSSVSILLLQTPGTPLTQPTSRRQSDITSLMEPFPTLDWWNLKDEEEKGISLEGRDVGAKVEDKQRLGSLQRTQQLVVDFLEPRPQLPVYQNMTTMAGKQQKLTSKSQKRNCLEVQITKPARASSVRPSHFINLPTPREPFKILRKPAKSWIPRTPVVSPQASAFISSKSPNASTVLHDEPAVHINYAAAQVKTQSPQRPHDMQRFFEKFNVDDEKVFQSYDFHC